MVHFPRLPIRSTIQNPIRNVSTKSMGKDVSSRAIRKRFLDYFIQENGHTFIRSSPVVPLCDPTVAFVNAGMNQFKGVFLGTQTPQFSRVANAQKCIRVGGKHNDLNIVGSDGYHQTFFEMLGNWSFNDYHKEKACAYAWNLLTNVYKLPVNRLYVTYFEGDETLGLPEDAETREVWRKLGVKEDRILPFGMKDNFWEMGLTGPCGPCTEIHVDNRSTSNRSEFVNKGLHDLIEVWNLVFIEYNRLPDKTIVQLPTKHVDTGMGFERLTSILQGKISNYDTDNFTYILNSIHKMCKDLRPYSGKFGESDWDLLDTNYRILADHARMVTVCLSDGIIPEQNQKLRRVLRKSFLLCDTVFKNGPGLLKELTYYISEELSPTYPEMENNIFQVQQILDYEAEIYNNLREKAAKDWKQIVAANPKLEALDVLESPNLVPAYKDLAFSKPSRIDGKLAFKLYDTYGLDEDNIAKLSLAMDLALNANELTKELNEAKLRSKQNSGPITNNVLKQLTTCDKTNDDYKYLYEKEGNDYVFEELPVEVLKIIHGDKIVPQIQSDNYCSLLLDKTNLYSEAGGQNSDVGLIYFPEGTFEVTGLENSDGYVLHKGFYKSKTDYLMEKSQGILHIGKDERVKTMRNHTATHLLNAVVRELKGATCQKSSKVTNDYLCLDVAVFGDKLTALEAAQIEDRINDLITGGYEVNVSKVDSQTLLGYDKVTLIPGEIYPENGIRIIEISDDNGLVSREPCCGTHVLNTSDLEDFCIIGLKSLGRSTVSITSVTGDRAKLARNNADQLLDDIQCLRKTISDNIDKPDMLEMACTALRQRLNYTNTDQSILPIYQKQQCADYLDKIRAEIKGTIKGSLKDFIELEMQDVLNTNVKTTKNNKQYVVHYLRSSTMLQTVPLQKATKLCQDLPVLVIALADNMVKARCCVPKDLQNENFNAEKWLKQSVADVFKSRVAPPKGQDSSLVVNMKAKKINLEDWDTLLNESLENAEKFVQDNL